MLIKVRIRHSAGIRFPVQYFFLQDPDLGNFLNLNPIPDAELEEELAEENTFPDPNKEKNSRLQTLCFFLDHAILLMMIQSLETFQ